jgi:hypothetical protein
MTVCLATLSASVETVCPLWFRSALRTDPFDLACLQVCETLNLDDGKLRLDDPKFSYDVQIAFFQCFQSSTNTVAGVTNEKKVRVWF